MVKIKDVLTLITYCAIILSYLSVVKYVGVEYSILFLFIVSISVYGYFSQAVHLPRWTLNGLSVLVILLSLVRITSTHIVEPILDALIILAGIKLLEDKKFRDYMQIYTICMFLLLGSSFISLSIIFLVYFSVLIILLTVSLILLAYFSHDADMVIARKTLGKIAVSSLLICLISVPATAFFFLILPRTNYPLFSFLNRQDFGRTGFSEDVSLGSVAGIQEDDNVIFRAEMDPMDKELYWRGIVLDHFDGASWTRRPDNKVHEGPLHVQGETVRQTIYLEPYGNKYLFGLDKPLEATFEKKHIRRWEVRAHRSRDLTHFLQEPMDRRIKYKIISVTSDFLPALQVDRQRYLQIPESISPKIRELVRELIEGKQRSEYTDTFYRFLKLGEYQYTIKSLPVSDTPLEDFLLEHRKGNCEYFASSMAVMLRMTGIPSRLVGGYKGGYYNDTGRYYMVPQKNAHVWVEAYMEGRGWKRFDPTTPYMADPSSPYDEQRFFRLKLLMDTLNYYWNKFVLNYDFSKQMAVARKIQSAMVRPHFKIQLLKDRIEQFVYGVLTVMLLFGVIYAVTRKPRSRPERLMDRFSRKMRRYGLERKDHQGLEEFIHQIEQPDLKERAARFVEDFEGLYYRDVRLTREDFKRLEERIREL